MSASMAEVLAEHQKESPNMTYGSPYRCLCGANTFAERGDGDLSVRRVRAFAAHQASVLAANGYGKLEDAWDEGVAWMNADMRVPFEDNPYRSPE